MYIIYVDESGKPHFGDKENFVLSSLIVNEGEWYEVNEKVLDLKKKWFPDTDPDQVELHAKDIVHSSKEFCGLKLPKCFELLGDIYQLIEESTMSIVSVVIVKNKIRKKDFDIESWALRLLYERLNMFLKRVNREAEGTSRPREFGLMLVERVQPAFDLKVRKKMTEYFREGTMFTGRTEFLIEDILFVESHFRNLSQLADCVAYCVRRKLRPSNTWRDEYFDIFFERIVDRFNKNDEGEYMGPGLKIFP
ncbi:MAG: DUF3800 domain-containing protein [Methanomassiliicoccales archaeon]|nr:MAG: DUF3800 domain-containing protein [Methanomassiliicoccales archaeon]